MVGYTKESNLKVSYSIAKIVDLPNNGHDPINCLGACNALTTCSAVQVDYQTKLCQLFTYLSSLQCSITANSDIYRKIGLVKPLFSM